MSSLKPRYANMLQRGATIAYALSIAYLVSWVVLTALGLIAKEPEHRQLLLHLTWKPAANIPIVWLKMPGTVTASLNDSVHGYLRINNFSDWLNVFVWAYLLFKLALHVLPLFILVRLQRFAKAVADGSLFITGNLETLRHISLLVAFIPIVDFLSQAVAGLYLKENIRLEFYGEALVPILDFGTLSLAALIWAISEIFKVGVRLQQEQELTI